jgi:hypothetical protein
LCTWLASIENAERKETARMAIFMLILASEWRMRRAQGFTLSNCETRLRERCALHRGQELPPPGGGFPPTKLNIKDFDNRRTRQERRFIAKVSLSGGQIFCVRVFLSLACAKIRSLIGDGRPF